MQTGVVIVVLERMSSFFFGTRHNEKLKNCAYIEIIIYISLTFYEPLLAWISGLFITLETGLLCIRFLHSQCIIILLYRYSCCKRLKWEKSTSVVTNNSILCNAIKIVFWQSMSKNFKNAFFCGQTMHALMKFRVKYFQLMKTNCIQQISILNKKILQYGI